jgi:hypothetical protein
MHLLLGDVSHRSHTTMIFYNQLQDSNSVFNSVHERGAACCAKGCESYSFTTRDVEFRSGFESRTYTLVLRLQSPVRFALTRSCEP